MAAAEIVKEMLHRQADKADGAAAQAKKQLCGVLEEALELLQEINRAREPAAAFRAAAETGRIE